MSRFEDTLHRDLTVIADRATPSPQAWQQIHRRIIDQEPIQETEIIMLTENTTTTRRWPLLAAAAAVAAVAIGAVALVNRDATDDVPADEPDPTPTIAPAPDEDAAVGTDDMPTAGNWVSPGRQTTEQLGMSVSFDLPRELWLEDSRPGQVMLLGVLEGDLELSNMAADNLIALRLERLAGWSTREEATMSRNTGSIEPDDVDEWIETNDVVVSVDREIEIDGRAARVLHARVSPEAESAVECFADWKPCAFVRAIANDRTGLRDNWLSSKRDERMHIVTIEGFEPVVIMAGGPDGSVWFDEFDEIILPSIKIGPDAPPLDYTAPDRIIGDRAAGSPESADDGADAGEEASANPVGDATVDEATALLDGWADAWNAADREAVIELFGTDAVLFVPGGREYVGEDAGNYMAQFVGSFPTLRRVSDGVATDNGAYSFDVEWEGSRQTDQRVLVITMADGALLVMDEQLPGGTG